MRRFCATGVLTLLCAVSVFGLKLNVSTGFDGTGAAGAWLPIWVSADQQVERGQVEVLRLDNFGIVSGIERFPFNGASTLEIPVLPETGVASVSVRLLLSGQVAAERNIDLSGKLFPGHIVLSVGASSALRGAIDNLVFPLEPVRTVEVQASDLPANALSYDSVSAIVMRDPGPVLSPAQITALKAWMAGGGKMLLTEAQSGAEGLTAQLFDGVEINRAPENGTPGARVQPGIPAGVFGFQVGMGGFYSVPLDNPLSFGIGGGPALNQVLKIAPYEDSKRLRIGRVFAAEEKPKAAFLPGWMYGLPVGFALWAIFLRWILNSRRKAFIRTIVFTIASTVTALAAGLVINGLWQRGAVTLQHALILPGRAGVVADFDSRVSTERLIPAWTKPWSLSFSFGETERGSLTPVNGNAGTWEHAKQSPVFSLRTAHDDRVMLSAVLPMSVLKNSSLENAAVAANSYRGLSQGGNIDWHRRDGINWMRVEQLPDNFDRGWAERVLKASPGQPWIFGSADISALAFGIENAETGHYMWAREEEAE